MRRTLFVIIGMISLVSLVSARVNTVDKAGKFGFSAGGGYNFMRGEWVDETFSGGVLFSARLSFNITSHLGIVSAFEYSRPRQVELIKHKTRDNAFLRIWSFRGGLRYDILARREYVPFIEGTIGLYHNRFSGVVGVENRNEVGFEISGGVEFFLMKKWSFTASFGYARYFKRFDIGGLNLLGDGGVAIFYPARLSFSFYF